jgi:hypothetical protein
MIRSLHKKTGFSSRVLFKVEKKEAKALAGQSTTANNSRLALAFSLLLRHRVVERELFQFPTSAPSLSRAARTVTMSPRIGESLDGREISGFLRKVARRF